MTRRLNTFQAAIFDLDGLMVDSEPIALEVWRSVLLPYNAELGIDTYRRVIGLEPRQGVEIIIAALNLPADLESLLATYWQSRTEHMAKEVNPRDGLLELMAFLRDHGLKLGVASNSPQVYVERIVASIGVRDLVNCVWGSDRVRAGKPAPDVYLAAAEELGEPPGLCLAVEDSPAGVAAAKTAGMYCIAIPSSEMHQRDFSQADLCIDSLRDLLLHFRST